MAAGLHFDRLTVRLDLRCMADPRQQLLQDIVAASARNTPVIAVWAWTLDNALLLIGIVGGVVNIGYVVWKWRREMRRAAEIDRMMSGPVAPMPAFRPPRRTPQDE